MKHLVNLSHVSTQKVNDLLTTAEEYLNGKTMNFQNKIVANLFFEPSTRTQYSFEAAEHRLGCKVISLNKDSSSLQKGESLYDTVQTFAQYADALVIRHSETNYYEQLLDRIDIPIINGGDGSGNHPTQSLLDLLTIKQEFSKFEGLNVAIVGDILHSRVAKTNADIMKRLGMNVYLCAPKELQDQEYIYHDLDDVISKLDIIMLLRVQFERHHELLKLTREEYHKLYGLTKERYMRLKDNAIIMHPAPVNRGVEIGDEFVECDKSRIFKQMKNGKYIRMAILQHALESEA